MKLRMTTNSVRLRLRKSDLEVLCNTGKVSDFLDFPAGARLTFSLSKSSQENLTSSYSDNQIIISLPDTIANQWINSDQVGIEKEIRMSTGDVFHVLIEKDFPCLDREEENKEDTFWELSEQKGKHC